MSKRVYNEAVQIARALCSGTLEQATKLTRSRDHSYLRRTINTRRKKEFPVMPEDELRLACVDLCDRNEQLEHVLRKMLSTVQVGLSRNEFGVDTLQELYQSWEDAA